MPLDQTRLGTAIAAQVKNSKPADGAAISDADLQAIWQKVAMEIINEIRTNGVVTVQTTTGPASGTMQ